MEEYWTIARDLFRMVRAALSSNTLEGLGSGAVAAVARTASIVPVGIGYGFAKPGFATGQRGHVFMHGSHLGFKGRDSPTETAICILELMYVVLPASASLKLLLLVSLLL